MYLPTLTRTAPYREADATRGSFQNDICRSVKAHYRHKFDLEYHGELKETRLRKCQGWKRIRHQEVTASVVLRGQTAGLERACIGLGLTLKFADGIESKHKGMLETVNMLKKGKTSRTRAAGIFILPPIH
ncbi:hypothetical protein N7539_005228, partial [Penicillium diatomitis]